MNEFDDLLLNASPELLQALADAGIVDEQGQLLIGNLKRADALRNTAAPQGHVVGSTNVYIPPNPLEFIGTALSRYAGGRDASKAEADLRAGLLRKRDAGLGMFGAVQKSAQEDAKKRAVQGNLVMDNQPAYSGG